MSSESKALHDEHRPTSGAAKRPLYIASFSSVAHGAGGGRCSRYNSVLEHGALLDLFKLKHSPVHSNRLSCVSYFSKGKLNAANRYCGVSISQRTTRSNFSTRTGRHPRAALGLCPKWWPLP